jgi:hypothetical protein
MVDIAPPDLSGVRHALGPATDTASHLIALSSADAAAIRAATEHLDAAIAPGGRAYEATAAVAGYVARLLFGDRVDEAATKVELLYFLGQVTEAAEGPERVPGVLGCREQLPTILAVAEHCETDDDEDVRIEAADTAESAIEAMERLGLG